MTDNHDGSDLLNIPDNVSYSRRERRSSFHILSDILLFQMNRLRKKKFDVPKATGEDRRRHTMVDVGIEVDLIPEHILTLPSTAYSFHVPEEAPVILDKNQKCNLGLQRSFKVNDAAWTTSRTGDPVQTVGDVGPQLTRGALTGPQLTRGALTGSHYGETERLDLSPPTTKSPRQNGPGDLEELREISDLCSRTNRQKQSATGLAGYEGGYGQNDVVHLTQEADITTAHFQTGDPQVSSYDEDEEDLLKVTDLQSEPDRPHNVDPGNRKSLVSISDESPLSTSHVHLLNTTSDRLAELERRSETHNHGTPKIDKTPVTLGMTNRDSIGYNTDRDRDVRPRTYQVNVDSPGENLSVKQTDNQYTTQGDKQPLSPPNMELDYVGLPGDQQRHSHGPTGDRKQSPNVASRSSESKDNADIFLRCGIGELQGHDFQHHNARSPASPSQRRTSPCRTNHTTPGGGVRTPVPHECIHGYNVQEPGGSERPVPHECIQGYHVQEPGGSERPVPHECIQDYHVQEPGGSERPVPHECIQDYHVQEPGGSERPVARREEERGRIDPQTCADISSAEIPRCDSQTFFEKNSNVMYENKSRDMIQALESSAEFLGSNRLSLKYEDFGEEKPMYPEMISQSSSVRSDANNYIPDNTQNDVYRPGDNIKWPPGGSSSSHEDRDVNNNGNPVDYTKLPERAPWEETEELLEATTASFDSAPGKFLPERANIARASLTSHDAKNERLTVPAVNPTRRVSRRTLRRCIRRRTNLENAIRVIDEHIVTTAHLLKSPAVVIPAVRSEAHTALRKLTGMIQEMAILAVKYGTLQQGALGAGPTHSAQRQSTYGGQATIVQNTSNTLHQEKTLGESPGADDVTARDQAGYDEREPIEDRLKRLALTPLTPRHVLAVNGLLGCLRLRTDHRDSQSDPDSGQPTPRPPGCSIQSRPIPRVVDSVTSSPSVTSTHQSLHSSSLTSHPQPRSLSVSRYQIAPSYHCPSRKTTKTTSQHWPGENAVHRGVRRLVYQTGDNILRGLLTLIGVLLISLSVRNQVQLGSLDLPMENDLMRVLHLHHHGVPPW